MDQIHFPPQGEQQKGAKAALLQVQAEDMAKERRKTSSSASQAFSWHQPRRENPAVEEARDVVEESLRS